MIDIRPTSEINCEEWPVTDVARFKLEQRNTGFYPNDGRWVVSQLPELYWSSYGTLRRTRRGAFLGIFDTRDDAMAAIHAAPAQPLIDEPVDSIGRVSC